MVSQQQQQNTSRKKLLLHILEWAIKVIPIQHYFTPIYIKIVTRNHSKDVCNREKENISILERKNLKKIKSCNSCCEVEVLKLGATNKSNVDESGLNSSQHQRW